ncbi:hypothetical protein OF829_17420 [Sphingomonas sp. LB-2]|uniref:hypothetical protein n=1 Tax=Sphingomonas caeni TaxID=2984949 RepID=UPI0022303682|nr:hypothetical protein [Sphingomonas caeni]MCW3849022.1 hypothetical protein [Sphingomonas caeni]
MKMLFGGILLAVGGLIALASGLCSGWFLVMMLSSSGSGAEILGMIPMILAFGGVPFVIGLGLFFWGRSLIRSAQRDQQE